MIQLAWRNLAQSKSRLVMSIGGVALALLLILSLDAVFTGMERQVTAYIDRSQADIFVAQAGVRNMHMASSSLPPEAVGAVAAIDGVASVTPILYVSNMVVAGENKNLAYIIGVGAGAEAGGPWQLVAGDPWPGAMETVIDRNVAQRSGVGLGDTVEILGRPFTVTGLSEGTASLVNSVAFIAFDDFSAVRGTAEAPSFLLVNVAADQSPATVAGRIESEVSGVTALSRPEFAAEERKVIRDMSTDVLAIMNLVGFLIGLAVVALTVYTATLSRRAEYGVLKALGAHNRQLYRAVLGQALLSVALAFVVGLAITWLLSLLIPRLTDNLALAISAASLLKAALLALIIAMLAALLPIRQIAGLDPATVFRG
jgi:putative ABC transport system permease protein